MIRLKACGVSLSPSMIDAVPARYRG